jgi:hypothetical protein
VPPKEKETNNICKEYGTTMSSANVTWGTAGSFPPEENEDTQRCHQNQVLQSSGI